MGDFPPLETRGRLVGHLDDDADRLGWIEQQQRAGERRRAADGVDMRRPVVRPFGVEHRDGAAGALGNVALPRREADDIGRAEAVGQPVEQRRDGARMGVRRVGIRPGMLEGIGLLGVEGVQRRGLEAEAGAILHGVEALAEQARQVGGVAAEAGDAQLQRLVPAVDAVERQL